MSAEYGGRAARFLEQGVDERCHRGAARKHDQAAQNEQGDNDGKKPVLLPDFHVAPEILQKIHR